MENKKRTTEELREEKNIQRISRLSEIFVHNKSLLIVLQDYPDPDAIASAAALKEIARLMADMTTSIACSGIIGRAENRALVKYLGFNILPLSKVDVKQYEVIAMVDTQPGTGNNSLPKGVLPNIVIDHHPINSITRKCDFHDIRSKYGATATIMYEYLKTAGIEPTIPLATALVNGIRSDTDDLGRETLQADIDAYLALYPQSNKRMLGRIQLEQLPRDYFKFLAIGLKNAKFSGKAIYSSLGHVNNPDMIGEVADLLLRNEDSDCALCFGRFDGRILLSLRVKDVQTNAGVIMKKIIEKRGTGGGHNAMAGGQINISDKSDSEIARIEKNVTKAFLKHVGEVGKVSDLI